MYFSGKNYFQYDCDIKTYNHVKNNKNLNRYRLKVDIIQSPAGQAIFISLNITFKGVSISEVYNSYKTFHIK